MTENKQAYTAYQVGLLRYEPWKVVAIAFAAGAAMIGAAVGLMTFVVTHWPG